MKYANIVASYLVFEQWTWTEKRLRGAGPSSSGNEVPPSPPDNSGNSDHGNNHGNGNGLPNEGNHGNGH